MKYKLVTNSVLEMKEFETEVNKLLSEGWALRECLTILPETESTFACLVQVLTKETV